MIHHRWPVQRQAHVRTRADQNPMLDRCHVWNARLRPYSVARGGATLAWWAIGAGLAEGDAYLRGSPGTGVDAREPRARAGRDVRHTRSSRRS